jgi:hypothetical protein
MEQEVNPAEDLQLTPEQQEELDKKESRERLEKDLKKFEFEIKDDLRYSFTFKDFRFVFRIPNHLEKTKIKAILAQITYTPGLEMRMSEAQIYGSGDIDLICNTTLTTHMAVLLDSIIPKERFNLEELSDAEQFQLGYAITICEQEFKDQKKKA